MADRSDVLRVRTLGAERELRGTGFLVAHDRMITALHNVGRVVNGKFVSSGAIEVVGRVWRDGKSVHVSATLRENHTQKLVVDFDNDRDWVLLAVDPESFAGVTVWSISDNSIAPHDPWETYGFPDSQPDEGKGTIGLVTSRSSTRVDLIQLFSREAAAGIGGLVAGYSGAPVIVRGNVVGFLSAAATTKGGRSDEGTLYAVPLLPIAEHLKIPLASGRHGNVYAGAHLRPGHVARSPRIPRLLLHYMDHFVLELAGFREKSSASDEIVAECELATRLALLLADHVFVPAVSYFQSSLCNRIIAGFSSLFEDGIIRVVGDAYSYESFRENRLHEYAADSPEWALYRAILDTETARPPLQASRQNTTVALHDAWSKLDATYLSSSLVRRAPPGFIPFGGERDLERKLIGVPGELGKRAFVARNIYAKLFDNPSIAIEDHIKRVLCELFFEHFADELQCGVVSDLIYLNHLSIRPKAPNLSYRRAKVVLQSMNPEFAHLVRCSQPGELLTLRKDAAWIDRVNDIVAVDAIES